ncbi:MAG: hypothetical protein ABIH22_02825 [Candidatus Margulisiibacteriota bacterium]
MAKKKTKKTKKVAKKKKVVKKKAPRLVARRSSPLARGKAKVKEKILGMVDHFFGHISVAAIKIKAPITVGDVVHIKGHTTDFTQKIDSMQIEHQNVAKAKKGDDIGIKVKDKVRQHDIVYLAPKEKGITAQPIGAAAIQQPMFPKQVPPKAAQQKKSGSYSEKKFFKF